MTVSPLSLLTAQASIAIFRRIMVLLSKKKLIIGVLQITEKLYQKLEQRTKKLRFTPPFPLLAFPVYLVCVSNLLSECNVHCDSEWKTN
jgi:hypothetical protein